MKLLVFLAVLLACSSSLAEACTRTWMYYRTQTDLATRENTTTAWYEVWDEGRLVCSGHNVTEKEPYFSNRFADGWCYDSESAIWLYAGGSASTATYLYGESPSHDLTIVNMTGGDRGVGSGCGCNPDNCTTLCYEWEICFNSEQEDCEDDRCMLCGVGSTSCPQY